MPNMSIHSYCCCFCLFAMPLLIISCGKKVTLEKTITLDHYSAGSAIAAIDNKLYLFGDNMSYLLVLAHDFTVLDSIDIINTPQKRLPKITKPDIEAATFVQQNGHKALLLVSSGSLDIYRNNAWLLDIEKKHKQTIDLTPFYNQLRKNTIGDLNIEGVTTVKDAILLCSRGNKSNLVNYLIYTTPSFWTDPASAPFNTQKVHTTNDSTSFGGVSDITYSPLSDRLIIAVSTEETHNSFDDGTIGKSYLCFVNNFSNNKGTETIIPDRIIDLEEVDERFKGQKIEAVAILSETHHAITLVLAADNDNDKTTLFKVCLIK